MRSNQVIIPPASKDIDYKNISSKIPVFDTRESLRLDNNKNILQSGIKRKTIVNIRQVFASFLGE